MASGQLRADTYVANSGYTTGLLCKKDLGPTEWTRTLRAIPRSARDYLASGEVDRFSNVGQSRVPRGIPACRSIVVSPPRPSCCRARPAVALFSVFRERQAEMATIRFSIVTSRRLQGQTPECARALGAHRSSPRYLTVQRRP